MQADGKKAEAVEREATALIQKVLDACPVPTRMSTIEGDTLYRNPASKELYGDRARIGDYYVDPDDRQTLVSVLLEKGCIDDFRVRAPRTFLPVQHPSTPARGRPFD